jgi:hypothetical protein
VTSSVAAASAPPPLAGSRFDDLFIQRRQVFYAAGTSVSGEPEGCGGRSGR